MLTAKKAFQALCEQGDYTMKNEKKALYTMWYQGRDIVEVLRYAVIYGKTYAEIRFPDGRRHTVPAEELTTNEGERHDAEH